MRKNSSGSCEADRKSRFTSPDDVLDCVNMHPFTRLRIPDLLDKEDRNSIFDVCCEITYSFLPLMVSLTVDVVAAAISLVLVGHYSTPQVMCALGLGILLSRLLGSLFMEQAGMVLSLMCSFFSDQNQIGFLYQKSLVLCLFLSIAITPILYLSRLALLEMGLDEIISNTTADYLWVIIPSFYLLAFFETTKSYLQAERILFPGLVISYGCILLNLGATFWFCSIMGGGAVGAGWARNLTEASRSLLLYLYVTNRDPPLGSWIEWNIAAGQNIHMYVQALLTHDQFDLMQACSWEVLGIFTLIVLDYDSSAAYLTLYLYYQFSSCVFKAVSLCLNKTVAVSLKSGDIRFAKVKISLGYTLILLLSGGICVNLHTSDQFVTFILNLSYEASAIIWRVRILMIGILLLKSVHTVAKGTLCILQLKSIIWVTRACNVVGVLLGMLFCWVFGLGLFGILLGWLIGLIVLTLIEVRLMVIINWEETLSRLRAQMAQKTSQSDPQQGFGPS